MSKKIDKIILDDFKETYSIEVDREKIYKQLQVKPVKENKLLELLKFKKICKGLSIAVCLLLVCVIVLVCINVTSMYNSIGEKDVLTKEFTEYMEEYSDDRYRLYGYIQIDSGSHLYIYNTSINSKNYYFYKFIIDNKKNEIYITFNEQTLQVENNSFGLLCEIDITKENKDIIFSIEYNDKVTEYKIG